MDRVFSRNMPHSITLTSPSGRVKLVPPNEADDAAISILRSHPITLRYLRNLPQEFSIEDACRSRELQVKKGPGSWLVFSVHEIQQNQDGVSSTFIGTASMTHIDPKNESCELGIIISPERQRGGYATETLYLLLRYAFEERKMHRVAFATAEENEGMRGLLEKVLGATLEGVQRECRKWVDGRYGSLCIYSILDWEWRVDAKERVERRVMGNVAP